MSNATLLASGYVSISFSGTAGEVISTTITADVNVGVGDAFAFKNQYVYVELFWEVTTAAANARVQVEAKNGGLQFIPPDHLIYNPTVVFDSNGYPWIGFSRYNGINWYMYVLKGNANDGTLTFRLSDVRKLNSLYGTSTALRSVPVPLTGGKMLVIYGCGGTREWSQYWDGSSWSSEVSTGANTAGVYLVSATAIGDTVHLVYCETTTYDIEHRKWDPVNGWQAVATIISGTGGARTPVITADPDKNELYCFWTGYPTANHVYYAKYSAGAWSPPTDWLDESTEALTSNYVPTSFFQVYESTVGLLYETKTTSPYNVKFAFVTIGVPRYIGDGLSGVVVIV
jgi:hypothetical protein